MADIIVTDNPDRSRYEAAVDGRAAGFAAYRRDGDVLVMPHTEVFPDHQRQGVADALVRHALDEVRDRHLTVDAQCSYVASWIQRHPEYQVLLARR